MEQTEFKIHRAMVNYLYQYKWEGNKITSKGNPAFDNLCIIHIPNAIHTDDEDENAKQGMFRKMLGVHPGAYDFIIGIPRHLPLAYDVKKSGGFLDAGQKKFREKWERCGYPSSWGTSVAHLRDTLIKNGAVCRIFAVQEPDLRTLAEKYKDAHNFQAPPDRLKP